jgi:selenophosphate synthase
MWADELSETDRWVAVDAQTSGGLLLAVPRENEGELHAALEAAGVTGAVTIGRLLRERVGQVRVARSLGER